MNQTVSSITINANSGNAEIKMDFKKELMYGKRFNS
jgi:hypothetical protein